MALKKTRSPFSVESYFTEIDDGTMLSDFLRAQAAETPELQDREPVVIPRQTDEPGIEPQTPVVIPERALEDERSGGAAEAGRHESAQPGHSEAPNMKRRRGQLRSPKQVEVKEVQPRRCVRMDRRKTFPCSWSHPAPRPKLPEILIQGMQVMSGFAPCLSASKVENCFSLGTAHVEL